MVEERDIIESKNLNVLKNIKKKYDYELLELRDDYAKIRVKLEKLQTLGEGTIVFEGEIYKCANFVALAAVNEKGYFVISSYVDFLSQIELEEKYIYFVAEALHNSLSKRSVSVKGFVDEIQVFNGDFNVLKLDHRSNIKLQK